MNSRDRGKVVCVCNPIRRLNQESNHGFMTPIPAWTIEWNLRYKQERRESQGEGAEAKEERKERERRRERKRHKRGEGERNFHYLKSGHTTGSSVFSELSPYMKSIIICVIFCVLAPDNGKRWKCHCHSSPGWRCRRPTLTLWNTLGRFLHSMLLCVMFCIQQGWYNIEHTLVIFLFLDNRVFKYIYGK